MADSQTTIASLRELNSKLTVEITELRKKYAKIEAENTKLKQIMEENTEFKTRFEEQDRKNKTDIANLINENTELKSRVSKLEQKLSHNDEEKGVPIAKLDDDTASYKTNSDDIPEQIKNISNNISNSDIFCESNIQYSEPLIHTESESSENKEIKFLNQVHRETVSNEIKERNREKKLQAQNSLSYNKDNSSCDIKTVSQGNDRNNIESSVDIASQISNHQKTIPNTPLPVEDLDNSDEIELTKNQNIELDLIQDLRNCMLIVSPDPIEIPFEDIADSEKPSSKITTQSLIHLFKKAIRSGHQEILSWICYSDNFENKVIEI
ncbi:4821_t:CDS:1 [Cetraspora pellucida]|uniref:4821_t:CDS:1 n=1 Tax=Cetraspora pellucida TaxID=1433469 RepID=A0ACA9JZC3_9GLOM|nr:4821_t:CDS:1 [Cetraspora pellucida]